jgi:hypothetical protein
MSRNVKSAFVKESLHPGHKMSSLTITSQPELCGGRGTRTHKPLRAAAFKIANAIPGRSRTLLRTPRSASGTRSQQRVILAQHVPSRERNVKGMSIMGSV